jgi:hypothetical protein
LWQKQDKAKQLFLFKAIIWFTENLLEDIDGIEAIEVIAELDPNSSFIPPLIKGETGGFYFRIFNYFFIFLIRLS